MYDDAPLDLFAEEPTDGFGLAAEELAASNAYSTWGCVSTFTSVSCPGSTFVTVGSASSN